MSDEKPPSLEPKKRTFKLNNDRWLNSVSISLFVIGLICVGYVMISNIVKKRQITSQGNLDCVTASDIVKVEDDHMAGLLEKDSMVKVLTNFYNCNEAKRGDVVWFRFSEHITPVPRLVRGLPGDRYSLKENPSKKGQWLISINDEELKSNSGPYLIESNTVPPLKTYEISRGGILQPDEYILLSNRAPGLSDSSNLGLVAKKNLAGKVVPKE